METANLLRDRGLHRDASEKYRELIEVYDRKEVTLDFATGLAFQALAEPLRARSLLEEAERRIAEYAAVAPADERARALRVRARICWRHRRYEEMHKVADQGVREFPAFQAEFRLERGKAQARLTGPERALPDLEFARARAAAGNDRQEADFYAAQVRLQALDRRGVPLAKELSGGLLPFGPLAEILLGLYQLDAGQEDPYALLHRGLSRIPYLGAVEPHAPDFDALYRRLKEFGETEEDPERVRSLAAVMEEFWRLAPEKVEYGFDAADLRYRAGQRLAFRAADLRRTDPRAAEETARRASDLFVAASRAYDRLAPHPKAGRLEAMRALLASAQACRAAGFHAPAARRFRAHYEADTTVNLDSLYQQGVSLMDAGIYETRLVNEPDAMGVFTEYLRAAGPSGSRSPEILLRRSKILIALGRPRDAAEDLSSLLYDPQYGRDPRHPHWAEGLLLRGLALLEAARRIDPGSRDGEERRQRGFAEARRVFEEYLERYSVALAANAHPPAGSLDAAFGIARAAIEERAWSESSRAVERMIALAPRIPASEREEQLPRLRQAYFLLGDLYYNQERYADALQAHETAFRKYSASEDRLGALIGIVRALLRLKKTEEALRAFEAAKAAYQGAREQFDASLDGRGREIWPARLREVEQELGRG
ncbi:MAG: hypothetical protein HYY17_08000 [Planctomycetes bacterium]|nr:hypothetical protein [Planctomycetota bacterium]